MATSTSTTTAKKAAAAPAASTAAADKAAADRAAEDAARVEDERKQREEAEKQREKDAKATEGEYDTTEDPDTAVDSQGDVVAVESGGAISQPAGPGPITYTDHRGINRIAGGFDDGWTPAPVDPDPAIVRQNEAAMARVKEGQRQTEERLGILGGDGKERPKTADEKADEENAKAAKKAKS